ncbi:GIY-YIG nuclease family protein [Ferrimonas lipolytica]|uniref:GIY-YIG nuclease family protein n=1 Tax=Ferrimonas lipolytica TaxID=2724191 RepID=A0A6H1UCH4_9GAMM|nr:GIY-YIG nuclease family protein [Ferrimonas lipolytica]QIZ76280.1 GIY-YIG nuclease family protein [Ferrimonas lipolytica]
MLDKYSFKKVGDIELVNDIPLFTNTNFDQRHGYVYLWLEKSAHASTIVYVGKAGKTLKNRCRQHINGFKNSVTGKKHAQRFRNGFSTGCIYEIYARKSDCHAMLDEQDIPMECVEEIAFIKKFKPIWNSA